MIGIYREPVDGFASILSQEEWAKAVEDARLHGLRLVRLPGLVVEIRDYSLEGQ